jgi:hypothetical protein
MVWRLRWRLIIHCPRNLLEFGTGRGCICHKGSVPNTLLHLQDCCYRCNTLLCWTRLYHTCIQIPTVKPTRCTRFSNYLILQNTLHVSDGLSVHHQEFKTVHTATGICQTDTATCYLTNRYCYLLPDTWFRDIYSIMIYYTNAINSIAT